MLRKDYFFDPTPQKLNVFYQRCLRKILYIAYIQDRVTNEEILLGAGSRRLTDVVASRRFSTVGHIAYYVDQSSYVPPKIAITWTPDDGRRRRVSPKKTWRRTFQEGLAQLNITWQEADDTATTDRFYWRQNAARCARGHKRN